MTQPGRHLSRGTSSTCFVGFGMGWVSDASRGSIGGRSEGDHGSSAFSSVERPTLGFFGNGRPPVCCMLAGVVGHGQATCRGNRLQPGPYRGSRLLLGPPTRGGQVTTSVGSCPLRQQPISGWSTAGATPAGRPHAGRSNPRKGCCSQERSLAGGGTRGCVLCGNDTYRRATVCGQGSRQWRAVPSPTRQRRLLLDEDRRGGLGHPFEKRMIMPP
ncbi:hypothetical protein B296_00045127 [Ensete ventricosum]|uniref:Uncharacterized protein n=1 Tax=Ensete ventricosum TaxID=4639 RepID=A0A426XRD4_ENSVE|nr:hypothetical protein B296_00045127 [Ensete ventricosum]